MKSKPGDPLTRKQLDVFSFIARRVAGWGYPPTYRDIMAAFGFTGPNAVACYLTAFRKKGYLTCRPHTARGITLTRLGRSYAAELGYRILADLRGCDHVTGKMSPMDSAPRDGSQIVLVGQNGAAGLCAWLDRYCQDRGDGQPGWSMSLRGIEPTHWIPSPEAATSDPET